ncbi:unnamed protein product [Ambrosiozyma monospora]|uniref:Pre-mRNA-splicing factor CWC2 n=1 Tax=Ambrosiozyma monospora TaxID=43982 RepID=A0A9W6Z333_AMBMO|nr:unnamed protein product [Ambrosiozyma monospora]
MSEVVTKQQKRKPARVQLDPATVNAAGKPEQTGQVFNIWYGKWTGGEYNGKAALTHSKYKCHVDKDSGYTKADKYSIPGSVNRDKFICVYFARGLCCNGKNCDYLHRLPTDMDFFPTTVDCFGREKFASYRDDMAGVGSFNSVNRTLYVGRINSMSGNIELKINKAFSEYGEIERMRAIKDKRIAFVTYKLESQAQFAKEAMHGQSLDENNENEALNIRWSNEDPDPKSQKRKREEIEKTSLETAKKLLKMITERSQEQNRIDAGVIEDAHDDSSQLAQITYHEQEEITEGDVPEEDSEKSNHIQIFDEESIRILKRYCEERLKRGLVTQGEYHIPEITMQKMVSGYNSDDDE